MESLNDDSLIRILSYLDLKSQQNMMASHPRFFHLMSLVWRSQYKTVKMSLYGFSIENLHYFFYSICKTVQVVCLRKMCAEHFQVLIRFVYPKVHDLRIATLKNFWLFDSDIPKLIVSFPSVRTFSPKGNFSGKHFTDFPLLERLTLTYCNNFSVENLVNVMKERNLKEIKLCLFDRETIAVKAEAAYCLESVKMQMAELSLFEDLLHRLDCLEELNISGFGYVDTLPKLCRKLDTFVQKRHFKILETCSLTDTLGTVITFKLRVDSLKIVCDNYLMEDIGYFLEPNNFEFLKQLFFKKCCIHEKRNLDNLMHSVLNVDFISFEECIFFFNNYEFVASKITEKRNKVLEVNLFKNKTSTMEWIYAQVGKHPLLQFLEGRNYEYSFEAIYMTFH